MMSRSVVRLSSMFLVLFGGFSAFGVPTCYSDGDELPVNNAQVLKWKATTKNQYLNRGHVEGTLVKTYVGKKSHQHYKVQIGSETSDTIEIIYNVSFGKIPAMKPGTEVEACGDYITSNAPSGPYPASPDGALVHWVHENERGGVHEDGYVRFGNRVYGVTRGRLTPKP